MKTKTRKHIFLHNRYFSIIQTHTGEHVTNRRPQWHWASRCTVSEGKFGSPRACAAMAGQGGSPLPTPRAPPRAPPPEPLPSTSPATSDLQVLVLGLLSSAPAPQEPFQSLPGESHLSFLVLFFTQFVLFFKCRKNIKQTSPEDMRVGAWSSSGPEPLSVPPKLPEPAGC